MFVRQYVRIHSLENELESGRWSSWENVTSFAHAVRTSAPGVMAMSSAATRGSNGNGTISNDNMDPPSPSKDRRRARGGKLRAFLVMLVLLLVMSMLLSQTLFWTHREDLESAVQYALRYANEQVGNSYTKMDRSGNRTMTVHMSNTTTTALVQSQSTVVTAYFQLKSKFPSEQYHRWMKNMLSMQDSMVIFTSPDLVETMQHHRAHALNRTVVISIEADELPVAQEYNTTFWQHQLDMDPEKRRHQDYPLFWIWLSKSWFVVESIQRNYFDSTIFMWSDIGCFRMPRYKHKVMVVHPEMVPRYSILQMAHHEPNPPPDKIWNNKLRQKQHFYHSGSQAIGYEDVWREFHAHFLETVQEFLSRKMFIGEDQTILQSTCLLHPNLCAYVPYTQVGSDNHYFGLRHVLHFGGNYTYWRPPGANQTSQLMASKTI